MLNSDFMIGRSKALAARLIEAAPDNQDNKHNAARIELAYQLLFSRKPTTGEKQAGLEFLAETTDKNGPLGLSRYLQALLSTHEFMQIQ